MRDKFILFILFTAFLGGVYLYWKGIIDFEEPQIEVITPKLKTPEELAEELKENPKKKPSLKILPGNFELKLRIKDTHSGLKKIGVYLVQEREEKSKTLIEDVILAPKSKEKDYTIKINANELGLKAGKTFIIISASDNGLFENKSTKTLEFFLDPEPPVISILYFQGYVINGGVAFAVLKVSDDVKEAGIQVGNLKFKCVTGLFADKTVYSCVFPYPYYWEEKKPLKAYAIDRAGNQTFYGIKYRFKLIKYRKSTINLKMSFIENKIKPLAERYPPPKPITDPIELFKYVNVEVRKRNEEVIHKITRRIIIKRPQFRPAMLEMRGAVLGRFADYRRYKLDGKLIEGGDAYHKGLDFASVKNARVPAAADGVVVFTGYLGIYGNTIIIEHGMGVFTLYSHLADFLVKKGQVVKKGQIIAHTDTTGLAVGDHLHFAVIVQGLEVHPLEWWDKNWLKTRFFNAYDKLKARFGEGYGK